MDPMACNPPVSLDSMKLGSIYIYPELMGEVKLVKFTPYMVILDGGSVWKFWPYWSIFSWNQPYVCTVDNTQYNHDFFLEILRKSTFKISENFNTNPSPHKLLLNCSR